MESATHDQRGEPHFTLDRQPKVAGGEHEENREPDPIGLGHYLSRSTTRLGDEEIDEG